MRDLQKGISMRRIITSMTNYMHFYDVRSVHDTADVNRELEEGAAQHVDDAPLYLRFGEHRLYGLLEPRQLVHAEEQHVLYAPVVQVIYEVNTPCNTDALWRL